MAFFVDLTQKALENAQDALVWMEEHSSDYAAEWYSGLIDAIYSLEEMPRRCAFAPENDLSVVEVRQLLYTKRRVTYRILFVVTQEESDEQDGQVRIYYIRHGAQKPLTAAERRRIGTD